MRHRGRAAGSAIAALLLLVPAALAAADDDPTLVDPLAGAAEHELPSNAEISGSIRHLEVRVVPLAVPEVRELQAEAHSGDRTTVTIGTDVLFAFDSAELTAPARETIEALTARIADSQGEISVVGHTDSVGTLEYNQELSERRAEAVAQVLREHLDDDRPVVTEGRNFSEPVVEESEDDPGAAAHNRRVEISFDVPD